MSPLAKNLAQAYQEQIQQGTLQQDPDQEHVIQALDPLLLDLHASPSRSSWLSRLTGAPGYKAIPGLYIWGGVGRGKTWLMDQFFDQLEEPLKQRLHFHHFMQGIHEDLAQLKGHRDPLNEIAKTRAQTIRVLCLDEFSVTDIADAMIIAGLLRAMFEQRMTLVTTSNLAPADLYREGIQRASFLPAIDLIEQHTRVIELSGNHDYRCSVLESARVYHTPLTNRVHETLRGEFDQLASEPIERYGALTILSRQMVFLFRSGGLIWFDFDALCGPPRSQNDYIELARAHHTVFLTDIPLIDGGDDERGRRFIMLVDEFYDRRVKLVISAAVPADKLYCGERLAFEFQRTQSRLMEMQSHDYLSLDHRG